MGGYVVRIRTTEPFGPMDNGCDRVQELPRGRVLPRSVYTPPSVGTRIVGTEKRLSLERAGQHSPHRRQHGACFVAQHSARRPSDRRSALGPFVFSRNV